MISSEPFHEYNTRVIQLLRTQVSSSYNRNNHPICQKYWERIKDGEYYSEEASKLIEEYYQLVEVELKKIISNQSIAYWLHLSRSVQVNTMGADESEHKNLECKNILDTAFQKYGKLTLCNKVSLVKNVHLQNILGGILTIKEFEYERYLIAQFKYSLAFITLTANDIVEYYDLCKLVYEIWRCTSSTGSINRGYSLLVNHDPHRMFWINRGEMEELSINYNERLANVVQNSSMTGTVFVGDDYIEKSNAHFLNINYKRHSMRSLLFGDAFGPEFASYIPNYMPTVFPLKSYREAHQLFRNGFIEKFGFSPDSIYVIIAALILITREDRIQKRIKDLINIFNNCYSGPIAKSVLLDYIKSRTETISEMYEMSHEEVTSINLEKGFDYLKLIKNREILSLKFGGFNSVFLPIGNDSYIIDYLWIFDRLKNMYFDVKINQTKKGDMLEKILGKSTVIPTNGNLCTYKKQKNKEKDNEKEIDYAVAIKDVLIIVECKAVSYSIACHRGDKKAIEYRKNNVVEKSISDVDKKAIWLANHPIGTNYDITPFSYILPIGVSPFREYIHTLDKKYWITDKVPRVLSTSELLLLLRNFEINTETCQNLVPIIK
ncbi:hypothetical protein [Larkinella sp. C7]|uniref:hypothetical protein n=1 Tax=Larkinella sp. C7 TaxID=2576607 RepID=UPI001110FD5E|nr:hypothetical protein [Larkinella sp. C7]